MDPLDEMLREVRGQLRGRQLQEAPQGSMKAAARKIIGHGKKAKGVTNVDTFAKALNRLQRAIKEIDSETGQLQLAVDNWDVHGALTGEIVSSMADALAVIAFEVGQLQAVKKVLD